MKFTHSATAGTARTLYLLLTTNVYSTMHEFLVPTARECRLLFSAVRRRLPPDVGLFQSLCRTTHCVNSIDIFSFYATWATVIGFTAAISLIEKVSKHTLIWRH